jgi:ubiquinone/menaquinone biosynthesis C-methylase UbiE
MNIINKTLHAFGYQLIKVNNKKYDAESAYKKRILEKYKQWYLGELEELDGNPHPTEEQKVRGHTLKDSAILTWGKIHQEAKYLQDLDLPSDAFSGMQLLDIGSGPIPSALAFKNCIVHCLDPLLPKYLEMGFPIHYYERTKFVHAYSEDIPYPDRYFDAIISVNALDHVDNFEKTAQEIRRILKPGGKVRFHLHYHSPTTTEPLTLNDTIVGKAFEWLPNFRKVNESKTKRGYTLSKNDETYALWANF